MTNDPNTPIRGFMDGIDWEEHLGHDALGTRVFASERSCRRERRCIETGGCGVVEVEVRFIRWVEPQDLKWDHNNHPPQDTSEPVLPAQLALVSAATPSPAEELSEGDLLVEGSCGCIWCDIENTPDQDGDHHTARGVFPCTRER